MNILRPQMRIRIDQILTTLKNHLGHDVFLQVVDESDNHKGHTGYDSQIGVSHVAIDIVWDGFKDLTAVERQRLINTWLDNFFKIGLHSVRYRLHSPTESR